MALGDPSGCSPSPSGAIRQRLPRDFLAQPRAKKAFPGSSGASQNGVEMPQQSHLACILPLTGNSFPLKTGVPAQAQCGGERLRLWEGQFLTSGTSVKGRPRAPPQTTRRHRQPGLDHRRGPGRAPWALHGRPWGWNSLSGSVGSLAHPALLSSEGCQPSSGCERGWPKR